MRSACPNCGNPTLGLPNCGYGIPTKVLGQIYRLFDCYIQYANSEGQGMATVETAACGVHPFVVNYSAMEDYVWKLGATPINIKAYSRESETHCLRAIPDEDDFVEKLINFLSLPEALRAKKGNDALNGVLTYYTWEKSAKVWMDAIDTLPLKLENNTWLSPIKIHKPNTNIPSQNISVEDFINWAIINVVGKPELLHTNLPLRLCADLNTGLSGASTGGIYFNELSTLGTRPNFRSFSRQDAVQELLNLCGYYNEWEQKRYNLLKSKGIM